MRSQTLGTLELNVLLAVGRLADEAYGLAIRREVSARLHHDYSVGAIYTTLERLEAKGLATSHASEPLPKRGGRSRRQFTVTTAGRRALQRAQRVAASAWAGIGPLVTPEPS
jgi:DNA-binding PadR family transcriptional regulator